MQSFINSATTSKHKWHCGLLQSLWLRACISARTIFASVITYNMRLYFVLIIIYILCACLSAHLQHLQCHSFLEGNVCFSTQNIIAVVWFLVFILTQMADSAVHVHVPILNHLKNSNSFGQLLSVNSALIYGCTGSPGLPFHEIIYRPAYLTQKCCLRLLVPVDW